MKVEDQVKNEISSSGGTMGQRDLLQEMSSVSEGEVLHALRGLMERGDVSYTLDWDLMLEDQ